MEFKLDKRYALPVPVDAAWSLLSDIPATAACLPGAAITERLDERRYKGAMKAKVGPATMNFAGEVEVQQLEPASHAMRMLGKGADKAGSSASMQLAARLEPGETADASVLRGEATVVVSGKLAQFGSRLLVPVSDALLAQFVANFAAEAGARRAASGSAVAPGDPPAASSSSDTAAVAPATVDTGPARNVSDAPLAASPAPSSAGSRAATAAADRLPARAPARAEPTTAPQRELNALGLLWSVFKTWLAALFGRRRG